MEINNHHTENVMGEHTSLTGKKKHSKHHHHGYHRKHHKHGTGSSERHKLLTTVDVDRLLLQTNNDNRNETEEGNSSQPDSESLLNLLNTELSISNGEPPQCTISSEFPNSPPRTNHHESNPFPTNHNLLSPYTVSQNEGESSPSSKSGTMDEYSVSDLLTSDDSALCTSASKRRYNTKSNFSTHTLHDCTSSDSLYSDRSLAKGEAHGDIFPSKNTKRRERRISKVKNPSGIPKESNDRLMAQIEKYLKLCQLNYEQVEAQINSQFSMLSNALNYRRKVLIEEAKAIRNRKIDDLNETRNNVLESQHPTSSKCVLQDDNSNANVAETPDNVEDEDFIPVYNGIYEPWSSGDTSNSVDQIDENGIDNPQNTLDVKSTEKLLAEGNMTFQFDETESLILNKIGIICENLSSPQCTYTKGLTDVIGIIGDRIEFDVYTRNIHGEANTNAMDKLDIRIYDCNKRKLPLQATAHRSFSPNVNDGSVQSFSFTPLKSGTHEIIVKLNNAEIATSPFMCIVYPKLDLQFDNAVKPHDTERHPNANELNRQCSQSSQSGESPSSESDEDTFFNSPSVPDRDWIVQKGGKSSLLRSLSNVPSDIYATNEVKGMCAWQMRVTSACMNLVLSVGVKTRSGIPDLDEQFTCQFNMDEFVKTATSLDKVNNANHTARRKSSMFSRLSWTFTILMYDGLVRVTCHELGQDKRVEIHLVNSFTLFPFCSIIHHHKVNVSQVCPRPQLTFL